MFHYISYQEPKKDNKGGIMKYAMLTIIAASLLYGASAEYMETRVVEPGTVLEVHNKNGDIIVTGWQGDKVEINIVKETKKSADELEKVTCEINTGKVLSIKTIYIEDAEVSVTLKIKIPPHMSVGLLETANGDIELTGTIIKTLETDYNTVLYSANGDIAAKDNKGELRIKTSNGDITIKGANTICEAVTSNGSIKAEFGTVPKGGAKISTANGSIKIYLDGDLDCELTASTSNGQVSVHDLDLSVMTKTRKWMTAILGDGGPQVNVTTSNGSITIFKMTD
jgi:DUF4097 and DUF4098 domain-containing protein YvlB